MRSAAPQLNLALLALALLALAIVALLGGALWRVQGPRLALEQARERWERRPFDAYRLEVEQRLGTSCRYVIEVRDERITSVPFNTCSQLIWWRDLPVLPVGAIFALLGSSAGRCGPAGCRCDGVVLLAAEYDPRLGYPRSARLSASRTLAWLRPDAWPDLARPRACPASYVGLELTVVGLTPLP